MTRRHPSARIHVRLPSGARARRGVILCAALTVAGFQAAAPGQSAEDDSLRPLARKQRMIEDRYERFESRLFQLADQIEEQEPENAERLRAALERSGELSLNERLRTITDLLNDASRTTDALDAQRAWVDQADSLLAILLQRDADADLHKDEIDRLESYRQEVDRILDKQKDLRADAAGLGRMRRMSQQLDQALQRLGALQQQQKALSDAAKGEGAKSGAAGDPQSAEQQGKLAEDAERLAEDIKRISEQGDGETNLGEEIEKAKKHAENAAKAAGQGSRAMQKAKSGMQQGGQAAGEPGSEQSQQEAEQKLDEARKELEAAKEALEKVLSPKEVGEKQEDLADEASKLSRQMQQGQNAQGPQGGQQGQQGEKQPQGGDQQQGQQGEQGQQGQQGQQQGQQGESSQGQKGQQQTPGQQSMDKAQKSMKGASESLKEENPGEALPKQDKAIEDLEQAKRELEQKLEDLRKEQRAEKLRDLEARFRELLAKQGVINDETVVLSNVGADNFKRAEKLQLAELSADQRELATKSEAALRILEEDATTVVFPRILEQIAEDMRTVADRLAAEKVGFVTQTIERQILESLEELVGAVQEMQQENEQGGQEGGQQGGQKEDGLLPESAELKLLRAAQMRVNMRTEAIAQALKDGTEAPDTGVAGLKSVAGRQKEIAETATELRDKRDLPQ